MNRITWILFVLLLVPITFAVEVKKTEDRKNTDTKREILTVYDTAGRVVNQAQDSKGWHRVSGTVKLVAGVDTVTINTSKANGRQDSSFKSASTYYGRGQSSDIANRAKVYSILPLSGTRFVVVSSDDTDTATINFVVEGE
jgi:hypothetical protein